MSATEEISRYFDATNAYYSPTLSRRPAASNYDFPEKSQKKDKKWSIGSLFRRKKKNDSDSSSEENVSKKGFLRKKRKPTDKRKKPVKVVGTFDHVVLPACQNLQIPVYHVEDYSTGVLSDPTTYSCSAYRDRLSTPTVFQRESRNRQQNSEKDIFNQRENKRSPSAFAHGSLDNLGRRSRRELTKARVEARRDVKCGSSSDEDSQRSHSSSRFISDESLTKSHRDGSLSRRSRAARTERYIRRISREEENILRSKSDAESRNIHGAFCRKPVGIQVVSERNIGTCLSHSSFSGLSTVPLNHKLTSNSYKPINSSNYNTKENLILNNHVPSELHLSNRRSLSCDSHIHKAVTSDATAEHICFAVPNLMQNPEAVIRASSNYVHRQPPPPPPRDPRRLTVVLSGEGSRPTSYSFERGRHGYKSTFDNNANELGKADFHQWNTNCRSTSEDNLPCQPIGKLPPRPSSATPDTEQQRTPKRQPENLNCFQNFQYLTDRNPRSRKPIFIQCSSENDDYCKSISQKSLDFWKQKDQEELHRRKESTVPKSGSSSPQMFTSQTRVRSKVFLPDSAADQRSEVSAPQPEAGGVHVAETAMTNTPNTSSKQSSDSAKDNVTKRKSTNLEEALDELEAIYNSLRLGDEDLLERAEQREMSAAAEKLIQSKAEVYPSWSTSRGAMSDSSYSYEPFETADQHRRKRFLKKSHVADRKTDDMAFRKLNKERFATISDPQSVVSKVSYLLATPAYDSYDDNNLEQSNKKSIEKEPDITLDDVVYRTIKHANNTLKVVDPQPPFGIPLGPVSPAANSDYLHAVPDPTPTFVKNQKIPDIVKDDLAFRNLRKDDNKEPALPPLNGEDITNNNACRPDLNYMKKKRAIRSLSANISNLVDGESQQEISEKPVSNTGNDNQSLTDIADVMEFARQVLREKESKINASRAGFLSDTEANKIRYKLQLTNRETPKSKRLSFLNELRCGGAKNARNESSQHKVQVHVPSHKEKLLHSRPPRSSTADRKAKSPTKESTPIPLSPLEEKMQLRNDDESASIDTLLKAIAVEAKETSDRIAATLTNCNDSENSENGNAANEIDNVKISENLKTDDCVNVNIQLSNLDECSDHAKMCKKLLECVAGSTPEAEQSSSEINTPSSTTDDAKQPDTTVDGERCVNENSDSEHDYENISGNENDNPSSVLNNRDTESKSDKDQGHHNDKVVSNSPDLVKVSDESTEVDKDCSVNTLGDSESKSVEREDEKGIRIDRLRSRVSRWKKFKPHRSISDGSAMSETSTERIARYKDERRKQLAAQYGTLNDSIGALSRKTKDGSHSSSSSEGPRTTKTSRLRAAVAAQNGNHVKTDHIEKNSPSPNARTYRSASSTLERDKSSKRKSNLNRCLASEEIPQTDETESQRRRRRYFTPTVLQQTAKYSSFNDEKTKSDNALTASVISSTSSSPVTASSTNILYAGRRKSELSMHMENARRSTTLASCAETGKPRTHASRYITCTNLKNSASDKESSGRTKIANKENIKHDFRDLHKTKVSNNNIITSHGHLENCNNISRKMDELVAFARDSLARVEALTNKSNELVKCSSRTPGAQKGEGEKNGKSYSILRKKSTEDIIDQSILDMPHPAGPISILKRKVSQDEGKSDNTTLPSTNPPVTFSPSVVEPATTNRKQGILKKRRSLDESQVLRHRSCSPDTNLANGRDSRSILKGQRRSSLEEITRTQSPDSHLQSILKRKSSKNEDDMENLLNSPQGILKRKSNASSAGSSSASSHVSITTAVILAAAGGAEMVLDPWDAVKPILKKKSLSEEWPCNETSTQDTPKPILKKKSSTDTDDSEERPKRPILKLSRRSLDGLEKNGEDFTLYKQNSIDFDWEVRPILKQSSREEAQRSKLSFCVNDQLRSSTPDVPSMRHRSSDEGHAESAEHRRSRPVSVSDLVMNFEKAPTVLSTGAVPKKYNAKRNSERHRTQPITHTEVEDSLNFVQSSAVEAIKKQSHRTAFTDKVLNAPTSLNNDAILSGKSFTNYNTSGVCGKMSSDSAFQSVGDGLELEQDEKCNTNNTMHGGKLSVKPEPTRLELQMKAIAEEAKKRRLAKDTSDVHKYSRRSADKVNSNRFLTQPVTVDEVQEAAKLKEVDDRSDEEGDPSNLSLSERIKMFNLKMSEQTTQKRDNMSRRRYQRFQTQPVTFEEVESAKCISPPPCVLEDANLDNKPKPRERKGILKTSKELSSSPKSALRRLDGDFSRLANKPRSILKHETNEFHNDEGISSNDSASDSEVSGVKQESFGVKKEVLARAGVGSKLSVSRDKCSGLSSTDDGTHTSDGDSSGGREVRSIIGGDGHKRRYAEKSSYEHSIWKSKSQSAFSHEHGSKSVTGIVQRSMTQSNMAIAELQAKLQQKGESDWRKRHNSSNATEEIRSIYNDEQHSKVPSVLALKKDELNASSTTWRTRVEKSDAEKFTVTGRMQEGSNTPTINICQSGGTKGTPKLRRFKGKEGSNAVSTPTTPNAEAGNSLKRSYSVPGSKLQLEASPKYAGKKVIVSRPDDEAFKRFFKSVEQRGTDQKIDISLEDLNCITRESDCLLIQKKGIQVQKRRVATKNPVKTLASRINIQNEYTEILTGVVERETRRLNIEKLKVMNSNMAVEALAGLASNEDFTSVSLKKPLGPSSYLPYKDLMLLLVKGRRHVQTRLVNPVADSINQGDSYILITPNLVYNYLGEYSNIIEQSRSADIANYILQKRDMGCKTDRVLTVSTKEADSSSKIVQTFWELLGSDKDAKVVDAGHPKEDEEYELRIIDTNMIYEVQGEELVPLKEYWGCIPKIEILEESRVLVFDFGTELYVWSGKTADLDEKKKALRLAQELWDEGFDYSECAVCPITLASALGSRNENETSNKGERPEWTVFAKVTQHAETILFKEKFLDWPDDSRVIKVKNSPSEKLIDPSYDIKPCDSTEMIKESHDDPDFSIEGVHLGRGDEYFDEETRRLFQFSSLDLCTWRILESVSEKLDEDLIGHFYSGESYILRWRYRMNVMGRELSGKPSKHLQSGRDRTVFFFWQGQDSTVTEKGAAALLTVELDSESAPQIQVLQGFESTVFRRLFKGRMFVHLGRRSTEKTQKQKHRLYVVSGEIEDEVSLTEVPCSALQLRSRTSFILIDNSARSIIIWHGCKSPEQTRKVGKRVAEHILDKQPSDFDFKDGEDIKLTEMNEGDENNEFKSIVNVESESYVSLLKSEQAFDYTVRMFHFSSISGTFKATENLNLLRSKFVTPFPFQQSVLYSAHQPAIFMVDNNDELWLWQGWWPEKEEEVELADQTGSGAVRWQAERRAAMQTAIDYWSCRFENWAEPVPAYLVWAGLEPQEFINLFPSWCERKDIAELNMRDGRKPGETVIVEKQLSCLTRSTYPLEELLQRPLPDGVDPTHLEMYLSSEDFEDFFSMTKEEFRQLPMWKQTDLKKDKGLF